MQQANYRHLYTSNYVIIAALLCFLFSKNLMQIVNTKNLPASTDITFTQLDAKQYGIGGKLNKHFRAPIVIHNTKTQQNLISHPDIMLLQKSKPWKISANSAVSLKNNKKILLKGNVVIQQTLNGKHLSEFKTEKLIYYPVTQKVETQKNITYKSQGMIVKAKGLKANLQQNTIELVSNARGKYVNHKS